MADHDSILTPDVRIVLWCHPRSCSTSFERSVRQLKGVKVLHEPHQKPFFCGTDRPDFVAASNPLLPEATFKAADDEITRDYPGYDSVFIKDHAFFLKGNYQQYIEGQFANFKHTFLIRHPVKALSSLYKSQSAGFPFLSKISGYKELYEMYGIVKAVDPNPIVIDSDDLLSDPRGTMQQFCAGTGLPFDECMLHWNPSDEVPQEWRELSQAFHASVIKSACFIKPPPCNEEQLMSEMPREYLEAVKKELPFYDALHSVRMQLI